MIFEHNQLADVAVPEGWELRPFVEFGKVNKASLNTRTAPHKINYLDISSVGTRQTDSPKLMSFDDAPSRARRVVELGDTLIATVRPNLKSYAHITNPIQNLVASTGFAVVSPIQKTDAAWLHYCVTSPEATELYIRRAEGAAYPAFSPNVIAESYLLVPSKELRVRIGALLFSLDEAIRKLQLENIALESIAQTLFRSWFVRFDPVHAKAAGLAPEAMSAELAELFPSEFEESELGLIPKGWHPARLNSILELAYGKALKADTRVYGDVPVYGSGGIVGWHNQALCHGPSVIVGRKGTVGSVYWESRPFFPIDTVFYVRTKKPLTYCYQLLKSLGLPEMNTDAAVPGLNRENAYRLVVPNAPDEIIEAFDNIASRLMGFADCNVREIQRWSELRDHLLPRLISGKLSLEEAQDAVEEFIPA